jgi:hypothetical protein
MPHNRQGRILRARSQIPKQPPLERAAALASPAGAANLARASLIDKDIRRWLSGRLALCALLP